MTRATTPERLPLQPVPALVGPCLGGDPAQNAGDHRHARNGIARISRGRVCGDCGSSLFWQRDGSPIIDVAAGRSTARPGCGLQGHIFVADKGDYYEIADGLPQDARAATTALDLSAGLDRRKRAADSHPHRAITTWDWLT